MEQYNELVKYVLEHGEETDDRTGTGTISVFGQTLRFDLQKGFPAVTTKKLAFRSVVGELLWMLCGCTDIYSLSEFTHGVRDKRTIWHPNYEKQAIDLGYDDGELGPIYGAQWRSFTANNWNSDVIDQVWRLIEGIKNDPYSRRHLVSAWNPLQLDEMALPPCHYSWGVKISKSGKLNLFFTMRSNDVFLGLPFNIASYALLAHILASITGYEVGELVYFGADVHIYKDHIDQCKEQITREPYPLPTLVMPKITRLEEVYKYNAFDFELKDYQHHPSLTGKMSA